MPKLDNLENKLRRKPVRSAFNKIKANPLPRALKRAILSFKKCTNSEAARALSLWKLFALKARDDKLALSLSKNPNIVEGAMKIEKLQTK